MNQTVNERVQEIAARVAAESNLEFVHAEIVGTKNVLTIRIFIDKKDGVTHEDCESFSRNIELILDDEDFISTGYLLEVSSPGLERELYSLGDFEKFAGHLAKIKTKAAIDGQKNFRGRIVAIQGEEITFDDKTKGIVCFPHNAVAKANLEIDLEAELKKAKS